MKKLLILAGIVALTCSTQVFAENDSAVCPAKVEKAQELQHCKKTPPHKYGFQKLEEELGLTAQQKEQVKQLKAKEMEAAKPIAEQLQQKETEVQELRAQLRDLHEQNKQDFEAILTDKQLKKLKQIKTEHKQKFDKHKKHKGHKRPHPCHKPIPIKK